VTPPQTPDHDGAEDTTRRTSPVATSPEKRPATAEDLELTSVNPPPWQRVAQDERAEEAEQTAAVPMPAATTASAASAASADETVETPTVGRLADRDVAEVPAHTGEETVHIERPVVTGTAAGSLFGEVVPPTPVPEPVKERTSVRLGGGGVRPTSPPSALRRPGRGPRRANLQIKRFDPWSVLKLSLVLGIALFFVWLVAVGVLYAVLDGMGVWDKVNSTTTEFFQTGTDSGTAEPLISAGRVFGIAAIIGAVNIVLFSALATVGAFVYNVSADLAGGIEVTLAERE
jgi:hypothetical protein